MDDVHQTTKMTKMGRMTWTTKKTQMPSGVQVVSPVSQDAQVVSTASAVGAVSKDGCAVGAVSKWSAQQCCWSSSWDVHNDSQHVSTICSTCCHISVHQGWSSWSSDSQDDVPSVSTKVGQEDLYAKWCPSWSSIRFQCGKYGDQVGQQQKQGIQTDVREIKGGFKIPC